MVVAVAVVEATKPQSPSCRGRSHQAAITKLPSLSRSSRGRSRCRGRSHQAAITKLEHHRKPVEKSQKVGIVRTGPPPKTGRKISEGKRERKLSKSIQSEGKRERGERIGAPTRAKRAGAPGAPSLSPLSFLSPLSLFPSDCIDLLSFSLIFIYGGYFRFEVKPLTLG